MSDFADLAAHQEAMMGISHCDPRRGLDVAREYERIVQGKSVLCDRVQQMVVNRWELGQ